MKTKFMKFPVVGFFALFVLANTACDPSPEKSGDNIFNFSYDNKTGEAVDLEVLGAVAPGAGTLEQPVVLKIAPDSAGQIEAFRTKNVAMYGDEKFLTQLKFSEATLESYSICYISASATHIVRPIGSPCEDGESAVQ